MIPNIEKMLGRYSGLFVQGLGYTLLLSLLTGGLAAWRRRPGKG